MITLQLKRTARHLSDNKIKDLVLENGEPLLVESTTNTCIKFDVTCGTQPDNRIKSIWLSNSQSELLTIKNSKPLIGTALFVEFTNENTYDGQLSLNMVAGYALGFSYRIVYIDNGVKNSDIFNSSYNPLGQGLTVSPAWSSQPIHFLPYTFSFELQVIKQSYIIYLSSSPISLFSR